MPLIAKPRRIIIDLDPDQGFPVGLSLESTRHIEEGGERIADLTPHIESLTPDSPQALTILGDVASAATAALLTYQAEVQRLAGELAEAQATLAEAQAQVQALQAQRVATTPAP